MKGEQLPKAWLYTHTLRQATPLKRAWEKCCASTGGTYVSRSRLRESDQTRRASQIRTTGKLFAAEGIVVKCWNVQCTYMYMSFVLWGSLICYYMYLLYMSFVLWGSLICYYTGLQHSVAHAHPSMPYNQILIANSTWKHRTGHRNICMRACSQVCMYVYKML